MTEEIDVEVMIKFTYKLPADPKRRELLYGTADMGECVLIDMENDPAAFMLESESVIVRVSGG